jgi:hypothetical protein
MAEASRQSYIDWIVVLLLGMLLIGSIGVAFERYQAKRLIGACLEAGRTPIIEHGELKQCNK